MEFKREDYKTTIQEDGRKIREQVLTNLTYEQALELAIRKFNIEYNKKVSELNEAIKNVKDLETKLQEAKQVEADKRAEVQAMNGKKESCCTRLGVINK